MTGRRELFLEEMGLGPVWHLRVVSEATTDVADTTPVNTMDRSELESAVVNCILCDLHKTRKRTVFGTGDENPDWLLVGEAPGTDEDVQGEPFVGKAGKLLDNMLESIGLDRSKNVFITNALKCHPPGNRNLLPGEVARCGPYLKRQIELLKPKLIVCLGSFAAQSLLNQNVSMAEARGSVHHYQGTPMIVTYHPAHLLSVPHDKARAWEDLCLAKQTMQELCPERATDL